MNPPVPAPPVAVAIGILARNEESRIGAMLASLFRQTLFDELERRGERAEIWVVANACTDDTVGAAQRVFRAEAASHPHRRAFTAAAIGIATPGKINAWNVFVHELSSPRARWLVLMDADIRLGHTTTLWNLTRGLAGHPVAQVAVGDPVKDLALKAAPTLRERLSLATSRLTRDSGPQLTGQLYCIRAATARRLRLPRDLAACEDGFIKNVVCTDFLSHEPQPARIIRVPEASHVFEAYTTARDILRNQKRQMIGQTFVHVLIDRYLPAERVRRQLDLGELIRRLDEEEPAWLRELIQAHIRQAGRFWRLFPGACTFRLARWTKQRGWGLVAHLPATVVGTAVTAVAAWLAFRSLRRGLLEYWPIKPPQSGPTPPGAPASFGPLARPAAST
ncbi:MAG TPA: glycosyltransferase family A protein [Opitutaceae bacterium]|nr:glycosyltransferase family A protein [Opitutaceae bacterium]